MAPGMQYYIRKLELYNGELYDTQRLAILERLRAKWPTRADLRTKNNDQGILEVTEWIKPMVMAFIAQRNLQPQEAEEVLVTYVEWAFRLNDWSRDGTRKSGRLSDSEGDNKSDLDKSSFNKNSTAARDSNLQHPAQGSTQAARGDVETTLTTEIASNTAGASSRVFAWDEVELAIDATILGLGIIWLPLLQIKPVKGKACHWSDFTFAKMISTIEEETGTKINTGRCEFVYGDIKFTNPGAWNIVLKRFGEIAHGGQGNILRLTIHLKEQMSTTIETGESEVETKTGSGDLRRSGSKRAKSSFDGATSDFSDDSEMTGKERLTEWELPQHLMKRRKLSGSGSQG